MKEKQKLSFLVYYYVYYELNFFLRLFCLQHWMWTNHLLSLFYKYLSRKYDVPNQLLAFIFKKKFPLWKLFCSWSDWHKMLDQFSYCLLGEYLHMQWISRYAICCGDLWKEIRLSCQAVFLARMEAQWGISLLDGRIISLSFPKRTTF